MDNIGDPQNGLTLENRGNGFSLKYFLTIYVKLVWILMFLFCTRITLLKTKIIPWPSKRFQYEVNMMSLD